MGCTPKDSISAPPVEGLYDARSSDFANSPFCREQVTHIVTYVETKRFTFKLFILACSHANFMYNGTYIKGAPL